MTTMQQKTIQRLGECASMLGKNCTFEIIPNSGNMMKYVEEVINEDNGLEYIFRICVRNDGSAFSMCYVNLNLEEKDKELVKEYLRTLDEKSDSFTYELSGSNEDMLFVNIEFDLEIQQYLEDSFGYYVFEYIKPTFETCLEGMILLCEKELSLDDAVDYALNDDKPSEDTIKRVRYSFEHEDLCELLLTDSEYVKLLREDKENFLFNLMEIICENYEIEMPYTIEEFGVKIENYGEYELIRIIMPKPVYENNCIEIILSVREKERRYFTVEIGDEGKSLFICEWQLGESEEPIHINYKMLRSSSKRYIAEIKKCLSAS